jgi:hypothetical protein
MQETHCILVTLTALLRIFKYEYKADIFPVNLAKPTHILFGRSLEWSTLEADVTYTNNFNKKFLNIYIF